MTNSSNKPDSATSGRSVHEANDSGSAEPLAVRPQGPLVWITLSRPHKANALDKATVRALLRALDKAEAESSTRAIILKGAGPHFCAGADLSEILDGGSSGIREMMELLRDLLQRFERSRLAIVAAVHGAARAGGLEIALACDAVVATESATFGDAHLANALLPAGGATARLPRTVGWQRAKWLILSAAVISAETSKAWGIVIDVCADGDLDAAAERLALSLNGVNPEAFARAKCLLAGHTERTFSESLDAEIAALEAHAGTAEFQVGVATFLNRKR